jgi:replicative DNA helicase
LALSAACAVSPAVGSGSFEQDADIVVFVCREEYYLERERPSDASQLGAWMAEWTRAQGRADVIIGKHRHSAVGMVPLQLRRRRGFLTWC